MKGIILPRKLKPASSQAAWALLFEGASKARVDAHRIRHMIERAMKMVESSKDKERLYQLAGDIIVGIPERLDQLETALDRTNLALAKLGEEFLESRLPAYEKAMVDEAVKSALGKSRIRTSLSKKVVSRYLQNRKESF